VTAGRAVVVGAGLAGLRTVQALRRNGWTGPITLVGAEQHLPYDRPPLSKAYLRGELDRSRLTLAAHDQLTDLNVDLCLGASATALDTTARRLRVGAEEIAYDLLVIATGSAPRALPPAVLPSGALRGVHTLRTVEDAAAIRERLRPGARVVVIGGGFIGAEVAAAARALDLDVTIVDPLNGLMTRGLGAHLGAAAAARHATHGVHPRLGRQATAILPAAGASYGIPVPAAAGATAAAGTTHPAPGGGSPGLAAGTREVGGVQLDDGTVLPAELVVVGVGSVPATGWLDGSGVPVADGVLCDATLAVVGVPGVFAVGDVARWHVSRYGTALRAEHWTAAGEQAAAVARTACGTPTPYDPVPYVWSDQFGVRLQVFGRVRPEDEVVVLSGDPAGERFVAVSGGATACRV
jgi:NADPH-dependent 2,4-dienoyl-CoA reductase/sulfur reductase-like enzyme